MLDTDKIAPAQLIKDRYIPIEDVYDKLGVKQDKVQKLIDTRKIRYAEFIKPGEYKRSVHVDPVEIRKVLGLKDESNGWVTSRWVWFIM